MLIPGNFRQTPRPFPGGIRYLNCQVLEINYRKWADHTCPKPAFRCKIVANPRRQALRSNSKMCSISRTSRYLAKLLGRVSKEPFTIGRTLTVLRFAFPDNQHHHQLHPHRLVVGDFFKQKMETTDDDGGTVDSHRVHCRLGRGRPFLVGNTKLRKLEDYAIFPLRGTSLDYNNNLYFQTSVSDDLSRY